MQRAFYVGYQIDYRMRLFGQNCELSLSFLSSTLRVLSSLGVIIVDYHASL